MFMRVIGIEMVPMVVDFHKMGYRLLLFISHSIDWCWSKGGSISLFYKCSDSGGGTEGRRRQVR